MQLVHKTRKNYKGATCNICGVQITTGSKRGFCRICRPKHSMPQRAIELIRVSKLGNRNPMYGKTPSVTHKKKLSLAMRGDKNHQWKGGVTEENKRIRRSLEYRVWREAVFKRDGWRCLWCGQRGGKLNADHIKPFSQFPDLRFDLSNGRTLCVLCHRKTETWGTRLKICN